MPRKSGISRTWNIKPSSDGLRWSAYPAGDKPGGGSLTIGSHNSRADNDGDGANQDPATVVLTGKTAGSSIVVFSMGEFARMATPTDTSGTSFTKRGTDQAYAGGLWVGFGPRVYANASVSGSGSYTVSVDKDNAFPLEEITVAVFEVLNGASFVQSQGNAAAAGAGVGYSSPSITTTGPAVIFAAWSGDGDTGNNPKDVAVSGSGWSLIESSFKSSTPYVQFAIAVREVSGAGTYSCTWTPTASQGAAMQMLAVQ